MSRGFDPYYTWLGIPVEEQPPNHYRLLGLQLFESQPEVIQNALDQRMTHLKSLASGAHAALSQRLLNEVSQAGACLLRPDAKQQYDTAIRAGLAAGAQIARPRPVAQWPPSASPARPAPVSPSHPGWSRQADVSGLAASPGIVVSEGAGRARKRKNATSSAVLVAQVVVAGVIGLAAACFILFLVSPKHPLIVSLSSVLHPEEAPEPPVGKPLPEKPEDEPALLPAPPAPRHEASPEPAAPRPAPPSLEEKTPLRPEENRTSLGDLMSSPPSGAEPRSNPPVAEEAPPAEVHKKMVLDLTRPSTLVELPEIASGAEARLRIEDVSGLNTPYELKPDDGMIRRGRAVDVELARYAGVRIRLSLHAQGEGLVLEANPLIENEQGKEIELTQKRVKQLSMSLKKSATKVGRQFALARNQAAAIETWLASPGAKSLQLRGEKKQQLYALRNRVIPGLEQQMHFAETRAQGLTQLWDLVEQIHDQAAIHFVVRQNRQRRSITNKN